VPSACLPPQGLDHSLLCETAGEFLRFRFEYGSTTSRVYVEGFCIKPNSVIIFRNVSTAYRRRRSRLIHYARRDLLYRSNNPPCCSAPRHRTVFGSNTVSSGSIHLSSHRRCPLRTPVRNHIRCRRHKSRLGNMVACNTLDEFVRSTIDVGLGQV